MIESNSGVVTGQMPDQEPGVPSTHSRVGSERNEVMVEQELQPESARKELRPDTEAGEHEAGEQIVWLQETRAANVELVGSKAANLAKLVLQGFPVPNGFVIPTSAFGQHFRGVPEEEDGKTLQEAILAKPLPSRLIQQLAGALAELGNARVAVRSSGVAEDLQGASFAGQYDTFLGLGSLADVSDALRKCWASAFGERVRQYQGATEARPEPMAVLVQVLIDADAAGVAFTANPVSGDRGEAVVSAVRGLGERLVSGEASPDEWFVRGDQARAQRTPEQAIDEEQALRVARLAREVEAHFGEPQDIEWAIKGNELFLLQARPITTLDLGQPLQEQATERQEQLSMAPVPVEPPAGFWEREESHYPDPLWPATRSTFVPAVNRAFRLMFGEFSLLIEALEQREIGGWIYQRAVPLGGKDMPTPPAWLVPLLIRAVPQLRNRIRGSVQAVREDKSGRFIDLWTSDWRPALTAERGRLAAVALPALDDAELTRHLEDSRQFLETCLERHMLLNGSIQLILADYAFACRDLLGWDEAKMMLMFSGLSETSSAPARSLAQLAGVVRENPELKRDVAAGVPFARLRDSHPAFVKRFEEHVTEFGCRALRHELAFPTVAESPELLLRLLRDQVQSNYDPDVGVGRLQEQRQAQLMEARNLLANRPEAERTRFENARRRAEKAYPVREEHGFFDRDAPTALLRYALLEVGRRLVERGQLNAGDDVFYLEFDEAIPALSQRTPTFDLVERRKAERNWVLANPGPASYGRTPPPPPSMASFPKEARQAAEGVFWSLEQTFATQLSGQVQQDARSIKGIAASSGQYTGTVRVIKDETEFHRLQPGDVMVCPITSPVWSVLFPSVGALVTDSGGILSHSAIIAREYRIPAVVATGNATELLVDGQTVTVDGGTGEVRAL